MSSRSARHSTGGFNYGSRRGPEKKNLFHHPWAGRVIGVFMLLVTTLYVAVSALTWYLGTGAYAGAIMHSTRPEVIYALGQPEFARASLTESWQPVKGPAMLPLWLYRTAGVSVRFDEATGRLTEVSCRTNDAMVGLCPAALGAGVGDPEWRLLELFGAPSRERIDRGRKIMSFDESGYEFTLEQLHVQSIRFYPKSGSLADKAVRFLTWLIP